MYRQSFGSIGQVQFADEHEYYRLLGYLAKSDGSTELAWNIMNNKVPGEVKGESSLEALSQIILAH